MKRLLAILCIVVCLLPAGLSAMILLTATTSSVEIVLGGAVTTNQLPFTASFVDVTTTTFTPGSNNGASNSTTAVTMVAAPGASTQRQVKFLSVFNADTVAATVTIQYNANATLRTIAKTALAVGSTLFYTDGQGFYVVNASGQLETAAAGGTITLDGNVTGTGSGTITTTIANDAVTYAKMQDVSASDRLLGRDTASAGNVEELTVGGGIEFTGSGGIQTSALTGDVTKAAGGTVTTIAADSVALGTDTTNNYVASTNTSVLTGLTGGSAGSEGAALTLGLDYSQALSGDVGLAANNCVFGVSGWVCEGATANTIEMFIAVPDPVTSDKTITLPNATTTLVGTDTTDTLTNKTLAAANNVINADTAIALAANGANCSAGNYPLGVDASGAVEDCTAAGAGTAGAQRVSAYNSAPQTVSTATETVLLFNTEVFDNDTMHDTGSNTGRITITTAGSYLLHWTTSVIAFPGYVYGYVRKGGSTAVPGSEQRIITDNVVDYVGLNQSVVVTASAADYYEVLVYHNRGADVGVGSATAQRASMFTAVRLW